MVALEIITKYYILIRENYQYLNGIFIMNRIVTGIVLIIVIVSTFLYVTKTLPRPAGILYVNGIIYTFDGNNTVAQALAVRGNRIVGIGTSEEIQSRFHADTIIDLHGKTVLPGLIDGHAHMNGLGDLMHSIIVIRCSIG